MSLPSSSRVRMASHQHRVLLYTTCYNVLDGVTLTIRKLETEILATGHHVCILTTHSGDPANTDLVGAHPNRRIIFLDNAIPIPFVRDPKNPQLTYQIGFSLSASVQTQLDDFEPSIIHITVPDSTALHLIQYARNKELPLMGTFHSNIPEYLEHYPGLSWLKHLLGALFRHQYNFLQALYVPTPFIQQHLIDTYQMDHVTSLGVWGRGVDIQQFSPVHRSWKYRRSLGIPDDHVVVCWVGRLVPEKRPDIFAHVVRQLYHRNVPFHALVIGAGVCEEEIKALPNTTFAGWMSADQLSVAYASADLFLFPSAVETFGNVTLEAAASGLPVIVEAGCSGHLVQNGENGFACPADDADAFFEATYKLVVDDRLRRSCSEASRQLAVTMEKRAVVRSMFDNYSRVTDEFYTQYGGRHRNRDAVYLRIKGSFVGGNHTRPLLLTIVEYLFIVIFQVMWNMLSMFVYMQDNLMAVLPRPTFPVTPVRGLSIQNAKSLTSTASSSTMVTSPSMMEVFSSDISEGDCSDDTQSMTSMTSVDEIIVPTINQSPSVSSPAQTTEIKSRSCGDGPWAHALAKAFVDVLSFQCRLESTFRRGLSDLLTGAVSHRTFLVNSKRKNSSICGGSGSVDWSKIDMRRDINSRPEVLSMSHRTRSSDLIFNNSLSLEIDHLPTNSAGLVNTSELSAANYRLRRNQTQNHIVDVL